MTTTRAAELNNGVWTSWLPVTTAWTSQSACNTAVWARYGIQPDADFWPYIYDPAYGQSVANTPTCLPPQATKWWEGDVTSTGTITRYSMGPLVCPDAYSTVSTSVVEGSSTSIICCPTKFDFARGLPANGGIDGVCTTAMSSGQSIAYASPASDDNSYTRATSTYTTSGLLIAVPVEGYNFAASTISSSTSATTSASNTQTSPPTSSTSSAGPARSTGAHSSGLKTGAEIGIGVAAVALLVGIILAVVLLRRRRKRRIEYTAAPHELPPGDIRSELPGDGGNKPGALVGQSGQPEMYQRTSSGAGVIPRPVELQ